MSLLTFFNTFVFGPLLPIILCVVGIYFMVKFNFFPLLHPVKIIGVMFKKSKDPNAISPFKAVTMALAGTLGVGNIVGVATAITTGGAGSIFWMWISAFLSMLIKYSEIVLAVMFRQKDKVNNRFYGGAMYYIQGGIKNAKSIAVIFSILCILTSFALGNIMQVNAISESFYSIFRLNPIITGIIVAILAFVVIYNGVKSISSFTVKLIPVMSGIYIILSMYIIMNNIDRIPEIFNLIITSAFSPRSATGGISGYLIMRSMRFGVSRGILSNEAGCGTAPIAHASANNESPVEQGFWGIFEVFADTILLCSMTALVILISYNDLSAYTGIELSIKAYEVYFGSMAGYILSIAIFFFAYSTIICWSYYGMECIYFFTKKKIYQKIYIIVYCIMIVFGTVFTQTFIFELADFSVGAMTVINTICVLMMSGLVADATKKYFSQDSYLR